MFRRKLTVIFPSFPSLPPLFLSVDKVAPPPPPPPRTPLAVVLLMGNLSSLASPPVKVISTFVEDDLKPSGLYSSTPFYTSKQIRLLISTGSLTPRTFGRNNPKTLSSGAVDVECPICFLFYDQSRINSAQCCDKNICTECYLQVKPSGSAGGVCPFCNGGPRKFVVRPSSIVSVEEKAAMVAEESLAAEKAANAFAERLVRSR